MDHAMVPVATSINELFAAERPGLFARKIEALNPDSAAEILCSLSLSSFIGVWERLSADLSRDVVKFLPEKNTKELMENLAPTALANLLTRLTEEEREKTLQTLSESARAEVEGILEYPEGSVGRQMELHFTSLRMTDTVGTALKHLREGDIEGGIYIVNDELILQGQVTIEKLALSLPEELLEAIVEPVEFTVSAVESFESVVDAVAIDRITDIPVINLDGKLLGHFQEKKMASIVKRDATASIQAMVGASREERALSPVGFAVRKRIGWLQVNLVTAFLAASVVGIFEDTIAKVTALAILLPVVAGPSGNAGAQALAVTMRGLALREITLRHWAKVTWKEVRVGFFNGLGIAVTCGIGVYVWSGSIGLVIVITTSMVIAMITAGLAGALVPIMLTKLGQDPATASSIVLTTVTDIAGFFAFLGIASALMPLL